MLRIASITILALATRSTVVAAAPEPQQASLADRLDDERFLRGLADRQLGDLLEHYIRTHDGDAVTAAGHLIARQRMQLADPNASAADRHDIINRILRIRADLITAHPDDRRSVTWLGDQASDLYFTLLPVEGTGLTALLGLPNATQSARAQRIAGELVRLMDAARERIDRDIIAIEDDAAFQDDYDLQQLHRRLVEDEQGRRMPFFHGIGLYLQAFLLLPPGTPRYQQLELSAEMLEPVAEALPGTLAGHAFLYAGLARWHLGHRERATELLEQVTTVAAADRNLSFMADVARALSGTRDDATTLRRLEVIDQDQRASGDLAYRLIVADCTYRVRARQDILLAVDAYLALLADRRGIPDRTMRLVVMNRLGRAVDDTAPLPQLAPLVSFARAQYLSNDEGEQDRSINLFETALLRDDAQPQSRAIALLELARLLHRAQRPVDALQRFTELAEQYSADPHAERAMRIAAGLAEALYGQLPGNIAVGEHAAHAFDVLLQQYTNLPEQDRWRSVAGRIAIEQKRFEDARRWLSGIKRDSSRWANSLFMIVTSYRAQAEQSGTARYEFFPRVIAEVDRILPQLSAAHDEAIDDDRARTLSRSISLLLVYKAEALIALDRPDDAVRTLQRITLSGAMDGKTLATILRTRIDAYRQANRGGEAIDEVRRFLDTAPEQVQRVVIPLFNALLDEIEQMITISREAEARTRAQENLLPLAELLESWMAGQQSRSEPGLRRMIADAYRYGERYQPALRHYDQLLADNPNTLPFILGRAECLFGLGDAHFTDAMPLYKRIGSMGAESGGAAYWQSQLRLLQILDQVQRNTHRIGPRVEQLRQIDSTFGGERFRRPFDALARKYAG